MRESKVVCPKCGESDAIRKVSSIVSEGTSYAENKGVGLGIGRDELQFFSGFSDSTSRTMLTSTLARPQKPPAPRTAGWLRLFPITRLSFAFLILTVCAACAVLSFPLLYSTYRASPLLILVPVILFVAIGALMLRWIWVSVRREARIVHEREAAYPLEVQQWEDAVKRWEQLYYCYRDDGVFLQGQSVLVPAAQMNPYLYAKSREKQKREPFKLKMDSRKNRS